MTGGVEHVLPRAACGSLMKPCLAVCLALHRPLHQTALPGASRSVRKRGARLGGLCGLGGLGAAHATPGAPQTASYTLAPLSFNPYAPREIAPRRVFQRWPSVVSPNSFFNSRGCERQYCGGALTLAPSCAAACHGQRGS
ncbi:hypothetical protein C7412_11331 [Paraburkholderia silvatlantica]|nr:hypothetical protein C7412_11331 [Paraburkholderia silvatlantica]